jgi:hypothetical protein
MGGFSIMSCNRIEEASQRGMTLAFRNGEISPILMNVYIPDLERIFSLEEPPLSVPLLNRTWEQHLGA